MEGVVKRVASWFAIACLLIACGKDPQPSTSDLDMGGDQLDMAAIDEDMGHTFDDAMHPTPDLGVEADAMPGARPYPAGDHDFTLEMNDELLGITVERTYEVHIPASYNGDTPTALILNFHGGRGSAENSRTSSQLDTDSDAEGFIVVYPEAYETEEYGRRWNNGPRAVEPEKQGHGDDMRFVSLMLDELETLLNIDPARIFVTGISNGGMMAYRIGCEMSDRIAAIAPIATTRLIDPCTPDKPISVMHFHGMQDRLIRYEGGPSDETLLPAFRLLDDLPSTEESISAFYSNRNCPTGEGANPEGNVVHTVPDEDNPDEPHAQCVAYGPCDAESEVILCTMKDGGHTWPGGAHGSESRLVQMVSGEVSPHIDANAMMWAFFQRHPLTD